MASTYSSRLRLELIGSGEQGGAWAATANRNIGTLLEEAIAGYVSVAMADANDTLDAFDGATDEARCQFIKLTGTLTAARNLTVPTAAKGWLFHNATTGGFAVTVKTSGGTGIAVAANTKKWLYCDGTNVLDSGLIVAGVDALGITSAMLAQATLDLLAPPGIVVPYAGITAPTTGWLQCYGQAVSRTTYSALFTALSTTYGSGDGSTTFNLPDLRGRVVAGEDDMGGSSANRLTNQSGGLNGDTLGATGGSETHTLTESQLASHTHTGPSHTHLTFNSVEASVNAPASVGEYLNIEGGYSSERSYTINGSSTTPTLGPTTASGTGNTGSAGSGSAHNNVQPTIILQYIIRTGLIT